MKGNERRNKERDANYTNKKEAKEEEEKRKEKKKKGRKCNKA